MPRLSIVIPHAGNVSELEATLLSVLENRPSESEIIVVHDGHYNDPYRLGDEVVFVEVDCVSGVTQLLNAGVLAACSPVVHTLVEGVSVVPQWTDQAMEQLLSDCELAAVALGVAGDKRTCTYGIDPRVLNSPNRLRQGNIELQKPSTACAGPELRCGFFRRKVLLALGGFNASLDARSASLDFAFAIRALNLVARCESEVRVVDLVAERTVPQSKQLAILAVAYGVLEPSLGVVAREFARGLLSGNPSSCLGWCGGLLSGSTDTSKRIADARYQLDEARQDRLRIFVGDDQPANQRRAA